MLKFAGVQHSALCNLLARHWPVYSHIPRPILSFASKLLSKACDGSGRVVAILKARLSRLSAGSTGASAHYMKTVFGTRGFSGLCHRASARC